MSEQARELRATLRDPRHLCAVLGLDKGSKRQARGLTILCPWHNERTPSCSVTLAEDGTIRCHCFGCSAGGDALTLIAQVEGLDIATQFAEVLEAAARIAGAPLPEPKAAKRDRPAEPEALDARSYHNVASALLKHCGDFTDDPEVCEYLERRRLIIEGAKAGLAALPPESGQRDLLEALYQEFGREVVDRAGLVHHDKSIPDWSRLAFSENRLVIPWRGLDGSIAILQRRRLDGQKSYKYVFPRGFKPSLPFGAETLRVTDPNWPITFCEGALDCLALRSIALRDSELPPGSGVRACDRLGIVILGIPGLGAWKQTGKDWARFTRGRVVWIAVDSDAGEHVQPIAEDCFAAGAIKVRRWIPPEGCKDWCAALIQGDAERLAQ